MSDLPAQNATYVLSTSDDEFTWLAYIAENDAAYVRDGCRRAGDHPEVSRYMDEVFLAAGLAPIGQQLYSTGAGPRGFAPLAHSLILSLKGMRPAIVARHVATDRRSRCPGTGPDRCASGALSQLPLPGERRGHRPRALSPPGRGCPERTVIMKGSRPMKRSLPVEQELAERDAKLAEFVKQHAHPLTEGKSGGYDPLLEMIGVARIVMIGDGSHGTHEFYQERALITKRLIEEKGFAFVGLEVPKWQDVATLNQYVQGGVGTSQQALDILILDLWAAWTWSNRDMHDFVEWLRRYNATLPSGQRKVGFFGLDVHGFPAVGPVLRYLDAVDPTLAQRSRERYSGFDRFGGDHDAYGYYTGLGLVESCERQAAEVVRDLQEHREDLIRVGGSDAYFDALMAALAVRDSERYHRSNYFGGESGWNIRDIHMQDTLDALLDHVEDAKVVVWAHNQHVGDFRATSKSPGINLGQLARQRRPGEMVAVGFGQYEGSVTAARGWEGPPEHMTVSPGIPGSYDNVFHQVGLDRFLLLLRPLRDSLRAGPLDEWRGNRSIGVAYNAAFDRPNYVPTKLASRYDAFVHIDRTRAVRPLDMSTAEAASVARWEAETYPDGY